MMKKLPYLFILLLFPTLLLAQSKKSYVINAGGGNLSSGDIGVTYFIGDYIGYGEATLSTELGDITYYPNPVKTTLYLETTIPDLKKVLILNLNGVFIKDCSLTNNEIDFSDLIDGVYLLKIQDKNENQVGILKVIKN